MRFLSRRKPRKLKTKVGRLQCPLCNSLFWSVEVREQNCVCGKCGQITPKEKWQVVEVDADAYKCPRCGELVSDTPENHSISVWGGPEPVLVCPKCHFILRGYIHHEDPEGASIEIVYKEKGGYIHVLHKNCPKKEDKSGSMQLERLCVDPETEAWLRKHHYKGSPGSRVVLVYVCADCGEQQVIKASLGDVKIWDSYNKRWWKSTRGASK